MNNSNSYKIKHFYLIMSILFIISILLERFIAGLILGCATTLWIIEKLMQKELKEERT